MNFGVGIKNSIRVAKEFEESMSNLQEVLKVHSPVLDKKAKKIKKLATEYSKIMPVSIVDIINELCGYLSYPEGLDLFDKRVKELEKMVKEQKSD